MGVETDTSVGEELRRDGGMPSSEEGLGRGMGVEQTQVSTNKITQILTLVVRELLIDDRGKEEEELDLIPTHL